jgi:monooxygenase
MNKNQEILDLIIIGAGLSGIGTAYWLQKKCPNKKYTILEARDRLGGTWDLFRYPGVRSDSDMFTFGYKFKAWKSPQPLSKGEEILAYLQETAEESGIDEHIRYGHKLLEANWSSVDKLWTLKVDQQGQIIYLKTRFLYMCSGYYSYKEAHRPNFLGEEQFKGQIVQPQFWPKGLNYQNKKVVVIGSGATAITLVPSMAEASSKITMLQRSPTYVMSLPNKNKFYSFLKKVLPSNWAYRLSRWRNIFLSIFMFWLSKTYPKWVKKRLMREAAKQLPEDFEVDKHFNPKYNPWDQRLCVVPDGDLFKAIKSGKADVITDQIEHFTENGIQLKSGKSLEADIIILATGLKIQLLGAAKILLDGVAQTANDAMVYKGMMISGIPNLAIAFGYTNAAWTLKTDLTANYVCRMLNYMDRKGYQTVVAEKEEGVKTIPFLNLSSGYIKRGEDVLPQQGDRSPWKVYQNYWKDWRTIRFAALNHPVLKYK